MCNVGLAVRNLCTADGGRTGIRFVSLKLLEYDPTTAREARHGVGGT